MAELRSEPRSLVGLRMHHSLGDLPPLRMFSTQELVCRLTMRHCAPLPSLPPQTKMSSCHLGSSSTTCTWGEGEQYDCESGSIPTTLTGFRPALEGTLFAPHSVLLQVEGLGSIERIKEMAFPTSPFGI